MKKKLLTILICGLSVVGMCSCKRQETPPTPDPTPEISSKNPIIYDGVTTESESHKLKAPFTIYNEEGDTPTETLKYKNSTVKNFTFDNMYEAIRIAGENSTTKLKYQVQDANYTRIFIRKGSTDCFVFDGHNFVGSGKVSTSKNYILSHKNSYSISGLGNSYKYFGRDDYRSDMDLQEASLELNAGAYNYMFTKNGITAGEDNTNGFAYMTGYARLSELEYKPTIDGDGRNAYIFFNLSSSIHCDLGLIGVVNGGRCEWRLVRNCGSTAYHGSDTFRTFPDQVATYSTKYDSTTKIYSGFDDLYFEALGKTNGWLLNVTNVRTGVTETLSDLHYESDGVTPLNENTNPSYYRGLVASSYCPVVGNVWNWDCGAKTNVTWDNLKIARYIDDNVESYRSNECEKYEFFPDSKYLRDGYSQGAFCSSFEFGTRNSDGEYESGEKYLKGDKYLTQIVDYNNSWEE